MELERSDLNNNFQNAFDNEYYDATSLRNRQLKQRNKSMFIQSMFKMDPGLDLLDEEHIEQTNNEPYNPAYFKKRYCHKFAPQIHVTSPRTNLCAGCKKSEIDGYHLGYSSMSKWDYKTCTQLTQTDAYGKVNFPGSHSKTANYIRVQNETYCGDMIEFMYNTKSGQNAWNLKRPQLILSVTGGAQKFTLPYRMKKAFKQGLVKAATSTGAWIITGGTNTGVMRLVGEAVADEYHKSDLTVLGIATWGVISLRDKLIQKQWLDHRHSASVKTDMVDKNEEAITAPSKIRQKDSVFYAPEENDLQSNHVFLDPNHTHFVLVDDGSEGNFGKEIEFRAHLEAELRRGKPPEYYEKKRKGLQKSSSSSIKEDSQKENSIPMILIVVQGGPNTLLTVEESLKKNLPVLVLADSKGCADLIANACSLNKSDQNTLEKLIIESKIFDRNKLDFKKRSQEAVSRLQYIISKIPQNLINVFHLDSEESGSDIEIPILRAFLNTQKNQHYENLKLALQWNRSDIAKKYIFTGEEEFKGNQLSNLMEMALLQNKPEFVKLLLENGLNLNSFLTVKRLYFLYNSLKIQNDFKRAPLFMRFKKKYKIGKKPSIITFESLIKLLKEYVFEDFEPSFLPVDVNNIKLAETFLRTANKKGYSDDAEAEFLGFGENEVSNPAQNLFLWALLLNRIEIAILFWKIGEHQICNALFASKLLKSMSTRLFEVEISTDLVKSANDFEEMAIGVLDIFDKTTDDILNGVILLRTIPFFKIDCLQMAVEGDCQKFVALSAVQNLLTDIWYGKIQIKTGFKGRILFFISCLSLGLLAPFCVFERREKIRSERETLLEKIALHSKRQDISKLLREYLDNFQIKDVKEATLLPNFCIDQESSGDSSSAESSDDEDRVIRPKISRVRQRGDTSSRSRTYWNLYKQFIHSPRVHFVYDAICYLIFLLLFSYMVLCELNYYEEQPVEENSFLNGSVNGTAAVPTALDKAERSVKEPSIAEFVLILWIFSFMMEEVRQYFLGDSETKLMKNRLRHYLANNWNYLDLSGCLVFMIGMSLRFVCLYGDGEKLFEISRLVLCIDLIIWYMKLLHLSIVFKSLGPKLVMIQKMIQDLMFFMCIIAIFVSAFGVTTQATLYPSRNQLNFKLLRNVINKGYWPIYGEMKILDELGDCTYDPAFNKTTCPENSGVVFSYIALMIYMVIANVLLINLLIAMFSSTFQDVQENTDQIWKFQRYRLVFEYYDSPNLPPPFNFIAYFVSFIYYLRSRPKCFKKNTNVDRTFTLSEFYMKDEIDILLDRERKHTEEFLRLEKIRNKEQIDSRLKANSERLENLEHKLNEIIDGRYKEINQITDGINYLMSQCNSTEQKPPFILK